METPFSPKVVNAGVAGAASIVLVWLLSLANVDVPTEVGMALTVLISGGAGWFTRDKLRDAGQQAAEAPPETPVDALPLVQIAKK